MDSFAKDATQKGIAEGTSLPRTPLHVNDISEIIFGEKNGLCCF